MRTIKFGIGKEAEQKMNRYYAKVVRNPKIALCWKCLDLQLHSYVVNYTYKRG